MAGYYSVCECGSVDCPGGCGSEEPIDNETLSLIETPEGQDWERIEDYAQEPEDFRVLLGRIIQEIHEAERAAYLRRMAA